jgi:hypothetical protein
VLHVAVYVHAAGAGAGGDGGDQDPARGSRAPAVDAEHLVAPPGRGREPGELHRRIPDGLPVLEPFEHPLVAAVQLARLGGRRGVDDDRVVDAVAGRQEQEPRRGRQAGDDALHGRIFRGGCGSRTAALPGGNARSPPAGGDPRSQGVAPQPFAKPRPPRAPRPVSRPGGGGVSPEGDSPGPAGPPPPEHSPSRAPSRARKARPPSPRTTGGGSRRGQGAVHRGGHPAAPPPGLARLAHPPPKLLGEGSGGGRSQRRAEGAVARAKTGRLKSRLKNDVMSACADRPCTGSRHARHKPASCSGRRPTLRCRSRDFQSPGRGALLRRRCSCVRDSRPQGRDAGSGRTQAVSCPPAGGGSARLGTVVSCLSEREARPVAQRRGTPGSVSVAVSVAVVVSRCRKRSPLRTPAPLPRPPRADPPPGSTADSRP